MISLMRFESRPSLLRSFRRRSYPSYATSCLLICTCCETRNLVPVVACRFSHKPPNPARMCQILDQFVRECMRTGLKARDLASLF